MSRSRSMLLAALVLAGVVTSCSPGQDQRPGRSSSTPQAAHLPAVCDGIVPGWAAARIIDNSSVIDQGMFSNDLTDHPAEFSCSLYAKKTSFFHDFDGHISLHTVKSNKDIEEFNIGRDVGRPLREISTELGSAQIGPHGGLFFPVCNGVAYYTLVTAESEGPGSYQAARALGVAMEKALDEAQDCRENNDGRRAPAQARTIEDNPR